MLARSASLPAKGLKALRVLLFCPTIRASITAMSKKLQGLLLAFVQ